LQPPIAKKRHHPSSVTACGPWMQASMASASAAQPESRTVGTGLTGARALAYRQGHRGARMRAGAAAPCRTHPHKPRLLAPLLPASGRRARTTQPDNSAAMNTSTTTENMPAILGDALNPPPRVLTSAARPCWWPSLRDLRRWR
jgi:hypothetical protein